MIVLQFTYFLAVNLLSDVSNNVRKLSGIIFVKLKLLGYLLADLFIHFNVKLGV